MVHPLDHPRDVVHLDRPQIDLRADQERSLHGSLLRGLGRPDCRAGTLAETRRCLRLPPGSGMVPPSMSREPATTGRPSPSARRAILNTAWRTPLFAIPFALFFGTLFSRGGWNGYLRA